MPKFKTIITTVGAAKIATVLAGTGSIVLDSNARMAVGDGNGTLPTPIPSQTALVHEVHRAPLNNASIDDRDPKNIVVELVIPPETGGFWMREMALYDAEGTLLAVGNMAETYKPTLAEGAGRKQVIRMVIAVSEVSAVTISIDTTTVMATQDFVADKIDEHAKSRNHPDATLTAKGFTQLNSATNSTLETQAATPKAVKVVMDATNLKAPLASPALTGTPTAPTAAANTNSQQLATTAFVRAAITALINSSPGALDTLGELAAALGNDADFATTMTNALAAKAPQASPALTGTPTAPTAPQNVNNTQIATTAFVKAAITALIDSSPAALDTLNELAAALGNDPNFAATMTNALAAKAPLASPAFTGNPTGTTAAKGDKTTRLATTEFVDDIITEEAPFPDVWIPFNDSLQMLAGNGPYDRINIGSDYLELPSRSATFTRASTATYIDKSGVLQTAAINEPRFEKEGLLIEGQSTNLFLYSENFLGTLPGGKFDIYNSNLTGVKNTDGSTTFSNNAASPNTSGNGARRMLISSAMTIAANTQHTLSFMGKGGTHQVTIYGTGVPTNTTFEVVFPEDRFGIASFTFTSTAAVGVFQCEIYANPKNADHAAYNGNFSLRYFQIEVLPFATSYIPTNGAAATRSAEDLRIDATGNIPLLPGEMSLSMEVEQRQGTVSEYRTLIGYADTTLMVYADTHRLRREGVAGQNNNINISTNAFNVPGRNIVSVSQGATSTGNVSVVLNGIITKSTGWIFSNPADWRQMRIGTSSTRFVWGHIRNFRMWHRALTDSQLKSLR